MITPLSAPTSRPTQGTTSEHAEDAELGPAPAAAGPERERRRDHADGGRQPRPRSGAESRSSRPPRRRAPSRRCVTHEARQRSADDERHERQPPARPCTAAGVQPGWVSSMAQSTEPSAITEPTERSMPPVRITSVMPTATSPVIETCRSTSGRLPEERKMLLPFEVTGESGTPTRKIASSPQ